MKRAVSGRSPEMRRRVLLVGVLVGALLVTARAFQLGVLDNDEWLDRAQAQQGDTLLLPAARGTLYDRDGVPFAASHEAYRVAVAPREITDGTAVRKLLREHLELPARQIARAVDAKRAWVVLPGHYGAQVREALEGVKGIHFESVLQRFYPHGELARELIGSVNLEGTALGGMELELDSVLRGTSGLAVVRRDARRRPLPGAMLRAIEPTPGRDVYLTIDYDLQEIADQALRDALERTGAASGEMLLTDPMSGELLAAVSRTRDGRSRNWRAVTDPYEPGSTIKPFTVAALLSRGRASLADSIHGEDGQYKIAGRTLDDVHGRGWMTLAEALRESSNIGIAKAAARLQAEEQYVSLRDFGFGSPTGVSYPSEASGRLRRPAQWSKMSPASLAIGYELSVTPLQMAMSYGALANGGVLLQPRLVREVRSRDGSVERSYPPVAVRRVIPTTVSNELREVLIGAVEQGTGRAAALGPFEVAGKTGTTRLIENGRYKAGAHIASFAGFFPARAPQLVFIVKLTEPRGEYYGGLTAAPVTRATLEAALATRNTPLDRSAIATAAVLTDTVPPPLVFEERGQARVRAVDLTADAVTRVAKAKTALPLPDITGMSMRDAVRRLHSAGFRLRVEGSGRVRQTVPSAGATVSSDAVVRLIGERSA